MEYAISVHRDYVRVDFHASPTVDMVLEIQQTVSIGYPGRRRLYCLNSTHFMLTVAELQQIAENAKGYPHPPDRVAIVTDHAISYETARLHRHYRSIPATEEAIFRDEASAMAWLGQPQSSLYSDAS